MEWVFACLFLPVFLIFGYQWIFSLSRKKNKHFLTFVFTPHYYFLWIPHSCSFWKDFLDLCSLISWHLRRPLDFLYSIQLEICFFWLLANTTSHYLSWSKFVGALAFLFYGVTMPSTTPFYVCAQVLATTVTAENHSVSMKFIMILY